MTLKMNQAGGSRVKDFGLPDEGMQLARICRIIDLGLQERKLFPGDEKQKPPAYFIRITFELPNDRIEVDGESRPRWIDHELNISNHEKSKCFQWYNVLDPEGTLGS